MRKIRLLKKQKYILLTKTKMIETLDKFPEEFTLDELMDKEILIDKIQRANVQSEKGETISEEELDKEMDKWFK